MQNIIHLIQHSDELEAGQKVPLATFGKDKPLLEAEVKIDSETVTTGTAIFER